MSRMHGSTKSQVLPDPATAERSIGQNLPGFPAESLPLSQCAGRVLRESIFAERDQPPFDRVTMDGIAVAAGSDRRPRDFLVQGMQAAGSPPLSLQSPGHCIEIMTGASLPRGCDCVVPYERIDLVDDRAKLHAGVELAPWQNVHRRASDCAQGTLLLAPGSQLKSPQISIAAAAGMARLEVTGEPSIMVVSTGDELVEAGAPMAPHQIRRSNVYAMCAALRQHGFTRVFETHVPDDEAAIYETLKRHLATHEVLLLSGGVSMGRRDLVPGVLERLGVRTVLHGVAQRPGKPLWYGTTPDRRAVFGLPGNPVSTLVCLVRYVLPALNAAMGRQHEPAERIALGAPVTWNIPLTNYLPVRLHRDDERSFCAIPQPTNTSGDFTALALTDGFVELPPGPVRFDAGHVVPLYRW
jgi:molybdopterin molybdotransferase